MHIELNIHIRKNNNHLILFETKPICRQIILELNQEPWNAAHSFDFERAQLVFGQTMYSRMAHTTEVIDMNPLQIIFFQCFFLFESF